MIAAAADTSHREPLRPLADRAADLVNDWIIAEPDSFPKIAVDGKIAKSHARELYGYRKDERILILGSAFKKKMQAQIPPISASTVLREWKQRGWLLCDEDPKHTRNNKVYTIGGTQTRYISYSQGEEIQ